MTTRISDEQRKRLRNMKNDECYKHFVEVLQKKEWTLSDRIYQIKTLEYELVDLTLLRDNAPKHIDYIDKLLAGVIDRKNSIKADMENIRDEINCLRYKIELSEIAECLGKNIDSPPRVFMRTKFFGKRGMPID